MDELNIFMVAGSVCTALALMMSRFATTSDFLMGLFLGLGLGLFLIGLYVRKYGDNKFKALKTKWLRKFKK